MSVHVGRPIPLPHPHEHITHFHISEDGELADLAPSHDILFPVCVH
jgi:hypothetical protein